MNLQEIKAAVLAGHTVHWMNEGYRVITDGSAWWVVFLSNNSCVGLTLDDGETLIGYEINYFCPHFIRRDTLEMAYACGLESVAEARANVLTHAMQIWPYGEIGTRLEQLDMAFRDVPVLDKVTDHITPERQKQLDDELMQLNVQAEGGAEHLGEL